MGRKPMSSTRHGWPRQRRVGEHGSSDVLIDRDRMTRVLFRGRVDSVGAASPTLSRAGRGFVLGEFEPCYRRLPSASWRRKSTPLVELAQCRAWPRDCGVIGWRAKPVRCNTGRYAVVASAFPHFGEEDCLRGWNGSGTIFFGLCNLRCVFCQNWDISQRRRGRECAADEIAR